MFKETLNCFVEIAVAMVISPTLCVCYIKRDKLPIVLRTIAFVKKKKTPKKL